MKKIKQKQIIIEHYITSDEGINMLNIYESFVLERLASMMGKKNKCWPKQKYLARICRISERQLRNVLRSLEKNKILIVERTKEKNIYSFNTFWLEEASKFCSKIEAADAFVSQLDRHVVPPDRHVVPVLPIYNNKKNNSERFKDYTGGKYEPAESGEQPSWLLDEQKH